MVQLNKDNKTDVSLLEIQRPLSSELIKDYNHKEAMKDIHDIFLQLEDNYFYQVAYQEFLKYSIDENLEFKIVEDPNLVLKSFNSYEQELKNDMSFKMFTKKDYRNSVLLCEALLTRVKDAFENLHKERLTSLTELEQNVDNMKKDLIANHFNRLAEGNCSIDVSPYYSSVVVGLERVADHLVNVGYSIVNPTGSQKD